MPVEYAEIVEALRAIDTATVKAVAAETGFGETSIWRYRRGGPIPEARQRPLARALGLIPRQPSRGDLVARELYPSVRELELERQRPTPRRSEP